MKPITIRLTDTEAIDLLKCLKEKRLKHEVLLNLAQERVGKPGEKGNPEKLVSKHTAMKQKTEVLINKIVQQL